MLQLYWPRADIRGFRLIHTGTDYRHAGPSGNFRGLPDGQPALLVLHSFWRIPTSHPTVSRLLRV